MGPGSRIMLSPASSEGDGQDEMTRLRHALQHARHSPRKVQLPCIFCFAVFLCMDSNLSTVSCDSFEAGSILRRSESIERRWRSISVSSPERPSLSSGSGTIPINPEIDAKRSSLREVDLARGEQRLRAWLDPLHQRIKETNSKLEKEHASPPIKIGFSSVEALQAAMSYLVSRVSELAADKFMMDYCWNSGGKEPVQEKMSSGRSARRPWGEHLPTDAVLVFSLFSAYMDSQLTSNPLSAVHARLAQPFSALYTLKAPQGQIPCISPPHFDFVFNDADGSPSRAAIPRGARNLFSAILSFVNHVKINNGGRLDRMNIGPTGLNIACILE
ncbi:hypothetical protein OSTOST_19655 [Ostertagia ostertagi]